MHIRTTRQTVAPGGGVVPAETILDLPEAEALPMIEGGDAVALHATAEAEVDADADTDADADAEGGEAKAASAAEKA